MSLRQREEIQEVLRPSSIRLIALAVISFWLVMMALLVRREVIEPLLGGGHVLAYVDRETDTWMALYMGKGAAPKTGEGLALASAAQDEVCVGVINTQTRPEVRNGEYGQFMRFWVNLNLTLLSFPMEVNMSGSAWASREGGLEEFDIAVRSAGHKMRISAAIEEGMLNGEIQTAGETLPLKVPVGDNLLFSGNMGTAALNVPGLEPGDEVYVDTFDPMTLSVTKAKIACVGEETIEYGGEPVKAKVVVTSFGGVASKAWVSYEDEVLRAETPFGFTLRRITRREALNAIKPGDTGELLGTMAIKPAGERPVRGATYMRLRVAGLPEGTTLPEDDTQRRGGQGRYVIRAPERASWTGLPLDEAACAEFLGSDAFVQASHPKIAAQAREIIGDEADTWQRALRLYQWVYDSIEKTVVMSVPSALDVLLTKEGDCNEHTVLFAALARAVGVPTRIAIGVVWSEELNGFYYHAWPEVYVGRWAWMDPTLGQPVADATHIKLLTGSIEKWSQLLRFLGQLQIEVLDVG